MQGLYLQKDKFDDLSPSMVAANPEKISVMMHEDQTRPLTTSPATQQLSSRLEVESPGNQANTVSNNSDTLLTASSDPPPNYPNNATTIQSANSGGNALLTASEPPPNYPNDGYTERRHGPTDPWKGMFKVVEKIYTNKDTYACRNQDDRENEWEKKRIALNDQSKFPTNDFSFLHIASQAMRVKEQLDKEKQAQQQKVSLPEEHSRTTIVQVRTKITRDEDGSLFCMAKQRKTVKHDIEDYVAQLSPSQLLCLAEDFNITIDPDNPIIIMNQVVQRGSEIVEEDDETGERFLAILNHYATLNRQIRRVIDQLPTVSLQMICAYFKESIPTNSYPGDSMEAHLRRKVCQLLISRDLLNESSIGALTLFLEEFGKELDQLNTQKLQKISSIFCLPTMESSAQQLVDNIKLYMMEHQMTIASFHEELSQRTSGDARQNEPSYLAQVLNTRLSFNQARFIAQEILGFGEIDISTGSYQLNKKIMIHMTRNNLQTNPAVEEAGLCIANFLENNDRLANLLQNIDYPRLLKINEDLELGLKMRKANLKCMPIQQEPMTEIIKNIERELNYRFITFEEVCRVINEFDIVPAVDKLKLKHDNCDEGDNNCGENNYHALWAVMDKMFFSQITYIAEEFLKISYPPTMTPKALKEAIWNLVIQHQNLLNAVWEYCEGMLVQNLKQRWHLNKHSDLQLGHLVNLMNLKKPGLRLANQRQHWILLLEEYCAYSITNLQNYKLIASQMVYERRWGGPNKKQLVRTTLPLTDPSEEWQAFTIMNKDLYEKLAGKNTEQQLAYLVDMFYLDKQEWVLHSAQETSLRNQLKAFLKSVKADGQPELFTFALFQKSNKVYHSRRRFEVVKPNQMIRDFQELEEVKANQLIQDLQDPHFSPDIEEPLPTPADQPSLVPKLVEQVQKVLRNEFEVLHPEALKDFARSVGCPEELTDSEAIMESLIDKAVKENMVVANFKRVLKDKKMVEEQLERHFTELDDDVAALAAFTAPYGIQILPESKDVAVIQDLIRKEFQRKMFSLSNVHLLSCDICTGESLQDCKLISAHLCYVQLHQNNFFEGSPEEIMLEKSTTQSQCSNDVSTSEADCSTMSESEDNNYCRRDNYYESEILAAIIKPIPRHVLNEVAEKHGIPIYKTKQKTLQKLTSLAETDKDIEMDLRRCCKELDEFKRKKQHFLLNQTAQERNNLLLKYGQPIIKDDRMSRSKKILMKYYVQNEFWFSTNHDADNCAATEGNCIHHDYDHNNYNDYF